MRELTTAETIKRFMRELGRRATEPASVYLVGGATAVLHGWRLATIDIDIKLVPDSDALLRWIPRIKEELKVNIELAAPDQFIPEVPGWRDRSPFIAREGEVSFFHYDPYAQALAKIERGHEQDVLDVQDMFRERLVESERLLEFFDQIEPELYRYPAIDPRAFRDAVQEALEGP